MAAIEHLTIRLPADMAAKVRDWVAMGDFPDVDAAVLEALIELEARQPDEAGPTDDEWVRREVLPALARYDVDPSRRLTAGEVRQHLARSRETLEQNRC